MERNYENMMILRPDLSSEELEEVFGKITKKIEDLDGKVLSAKIWAKERNFFYFLKSSGAEKKKYYKGCYWLVNFTLDTDKILELKETIRLEERILRSIIINREGQIKLKFAKRSKHDPSTSSRLRSERDRGV